MLARRLGRRPYQPLFESHDTSANGDDEDVGKVNPNLIDLSGTTLHVGCQRMTQNQQENRNDICG
jgi:hypothetical protein